MKEWKDITHYLNYLPYDMVVDLKPALLNFITTTNKLTTQDGKEIKIRREMAYVTDEPVIYKYANLGLQGQAWNSSLAYLRDKLNEDFGFEFNSVLINVYQDGKDEIKWHSDKEEQLGKNPTIACLNFGATRKFWFLEKETGRKLYCPLSERDLLVMGPNCQENYLHAILPEKEIEDSRISLTFRRVL